MSAYNDDDYFCGNVQLRLNYSETLQILSDSLKQFSKACLCLFLIVLRAHKYRKVVCSLCFRQAFSSFFC